MSAAAYKLSENPQPASRDDETVERRPQLYLVSSQTTPPPETSLLLELYQNWPPLLWRLGQSLWSFACDVATAPQPCPLSSHLPHIEKDPRPYISYFGVR